MDELMRCMPHVYDGSFRSAENLARFPHGAEVQMQDEECEPELRGQLHLERPLFTAWLDAGTHHCARTLRLHAEPMQPEELRGAATGDTAFDLCYRRMYQKDLPSTGSPGMGSQDLANFIIWIIEDSRLPDDFVSPIQSVPHADLTARGKTLRTETDREEMRVG